MSAPVLHDVIPALVTPFKADGPVGDNTGDSFGKSLKSIPGVTDVVVTAHTRDGSSLLEEERPEIIAAVAAKVANPHIMAGVSGEGTAVVATEAGMSREAGAYSILWFLIVSRTPFGYQEPSDDDRYRAVYDASEFLISPFKWADTTKVTYLLDASLELWALEGVFAIKDGARDRLPWDGETPIVLRSFPDTRMLRCQGEFRLHKMRKSNGALVGYAALVSKLALEPLEKVKASDYVAAKDAYDWMMPATRAVNHLKLYTDSTKAMKLGLVKRGLLKNVIVRSPLMPLEAEARGQVASAIKSTNEI